MNEFNWPQVIFYRSTSPAFLASPLMASAAGVGIWAA
jgi:hypothetical protein